MDEKMNFSLYLNQGEIKNNVKSRIRTKELSITRVTSWKDYFYLDPKEFGNFNFFTHKKGKMTFTPKRLQKL